MRSRYLFLVITPILLLSSIARANWPLDGLGVAVGAGNGVKPGAVPDGQGGFFVVWQDNRNDGNDIYAQRFNVLGEPQWTLNGVAVCTAVNSQVNVSMVADGAGGVVVAWDDFRNGSHYDIFAQRLNSAGVPQWTANGVALTTATGAQTGVKLAAENTGGAIAAWTDNRSGTNKIYGQRITGAGAVQWTSLGVGICNNSGEQIDHVVVSDGAGGAIYAWRDKRSDPLGDLYASRVSASAVLQWLPFTGVLVCGVSPYKPSAISDGFGGIIIAWDENRGFGNNIFAQRVSHAGVGLWIPDGMPVPAGGGFQVFPSLASDGTGGAIIAWRDFVGGHFRVYANRINSTGLHDWPGNVAVCTEPGGEQYPIEYAAVTSDGAGGAIVAWDDYRNGEQDEADIYAQRLDPEGVRLWPSDGAEVMADDVFHSGLTIISNEPGGAVLLFADDRYPTAADLFAQRLDPKHGYRGGPEPVLVEVDDVPADQGGSVKVKWLASAHDVFNLQTITHYSIWRATDEVVSANGLMVADPSEVPEDFEGAAYWKQRVGTTDYYWEWLANRDAHYLSAYTYTAPTLTDWTLVDPNDHFFFISAHATEPFVFFDSNILSGHSIDNIAPGAPLTLTAYRVGSSVVLNWNRPLAQDLRDFAVYRATSSGVTPIGGNFVAGTADTTLVDANAPGSTLYYIVTAYDVHDNQSAPSNEANVGVVTGIGDTPAITALAVLQNYPNPFAGSTQLEIGLPAKSDVSIDVFDVAGRRVRTMNVSGAAAGWQRVPFTATDDHGGALASGVYFCRVTAAGTTVTHKMVIAR